MNNQLIDALPVVDTGVELCAVAEICHGRNMSRLYVQVAVQVSIHQYRRKKQFKRWIQNAPNLMPCIN